MPSSHLNHTANGKYMQYCTAAITPIVVYSRFSYNFNCWTVVLMIDNTFISMYHIDLVAPYHLVIILLIYYAYSYTHNPLIYSCVIYCYIFLLKEGSNKYIIMCSNVLSTYSQRPSLFLKTKAREFVSSAQYNTINIKASACTRSRDSALSH